jgi:hypothetical protein
MLLALPIVLPLVTAIALHLLPQRSRLLRVVAFAGSLGSVVVAVSVFIRVLRTGIQVLQVGGWPAPFGITLVADLFSAALIVTASAIGLAVTGSSFAGVDPRREALGYHPLIQVVLMGVTGAFLTGDIFNLYVWFEVMLIGSFVLMSLHRTRAQLHAAFTYVGLNLLASAFLLTAIGLLYGQAGTLNLADLARAWPERRTPGLDAALSMLFLTAFGIKAGLFPLFFWLPASYHTPPAAVGALLAGLLTKVGVYAMIRVFTLLFPDPDASVYRVLLVLSAITMVVGLIGALAQRDFRRVLSFNLVGHIGFTTVGLALWTPAALPRERSVPSATTDDRLERARRALSIAAGGGLSGAGSTVLARRRPSPVRFRRESCRGGADAWRRSLFARGGGVVREPADVVVGRPAVGGRFLETCTVAFVPVCRAASTRDADCCAHRVPRHSDARADSAGRPAVQPDDEGCGTTARQELVRPGRSGRGRAACCSVTCSWRWRGPRFTGTSRC